MAELEKVIKALEVCSKIDDSCKNCPYSKYKDVEDCSNTLLKDTLELLKNHEPKAVDEHGRMFTIRYGSCPNCLKPIDSDVNPNACGFCGQRLDWEGR